MIKRLRRNFVLVTMALVSVVLLTVWAGICLYFSGNLRGEGYRALEMALSRPHGDKPPNFQLGGKLPDGYGHDPVFVASVGADGTARLTLSDRISVNEADLQAIVDQALATGESRGELPGYDLRFLMDQKGGREVGIAFMALTLERAQVGSVIMISGLAVLGAFVVFFLASVLLARWVLRPVERAWQKQRRFVADASHELKTPLTVILANTGILKSHGNDTVANQMTWVENTEQEARRMKGLVDDLLFLAKSDDAALAVPRQAVALSDAVATAALAFEPVAFEQGVSLELAVEPRITLQGNEPALRQLVGILLDNAVKYGQKNSAVTLSLARRQNQVELSVHNAGAAIPPEVQRHLFDRFYRADPSRGAQQGYGLGLAIAQSITAAHHGRIAVESGAGGTTFTVSLPQK